MSDDDQFFIFKLNDAFILRVISVMKSVLIVNTIEVDKH